MIEVLVVLVIIGVLVAAAWGMRAGTKKATEGQRGVAVARSYADALDAFARDHGNRVPVMGSEDWPVHAPGADRSGGPFPPFANGPVDIAENGRSYLDGVPEPVATNAVIVTGASTTAQQPMATVRVLYSAPDASTWRLDVQARESQNDGDASWTTQCSLGHALPQGTRTC
ncbi:MAG: hypothetical protein JWN72_1609 [Thermoleophilia bacterium]|nr:hypothetical protein [Thermoleophilia bacterium]